MSESSLNHDETKQIHTPLGGSEPSSQAPQCVGMTTNILEISSHLVKTRAHWFLWFAPLSWDVTPWFN